MEHMPVWQAFEGKSASADDIEADLVDRRVPLEIWANPVKDEHGKVDIASGGVPGHHPAQASAGRAGGIPPSSRAIGQASERPIDRGQ